MAQADVFIVVAALISALVGGVAVALLNFWLTREMRAAEFQKIKLEIEKTRREVGSISSAVSYQTFDAQEQMVYDGRKQDVGFDFEGLGERLYKRIDDVDQPISGPAQGSLSFEDGGLLNINRTNTEGRFSIYLKSYYFGGTKYLTIPGNPRLTGERRFRVRFEAKAIDSSHTLRVVLRNKKGEWLDENEQSITSNMWTPMKNFYFVISPSEECQLWIDDIDVTKAPSSVQIRNFVLTERLPLS